MTVLVMHFTRLAKSLRDPAIVESGRADMAKQLQTLDAHLARHRYLAGDAFTIADISAAPSVHRWLLFDLERPRMPHLEDWHARLAVPPAFQKHVAPREYHIDD
jgi:glutathione S-transferase